MHDLPCYANVGHGSSSPGRPAMIIIVYTATLRLHSMWTLAAAISVTTSFTTISQAMFADGIEHAILAFTLWQVCYLCAAKSELVRCACLL